MRQNKRIVSLIIVSMFVATDRSLADKPKPEVETVYFDYVDEHGQLGGGSLQLPFEKPLWARKSDDPELRGASGNRVDIVVVGDGYTAAQQSIFHAHADSAMATFFVQQPFATYAPLFNIHQVEVLSAESGVDNDPTQGILRNTALDMAFWCNGTERLLCVSVTKAYTAAAVSPRCRPRACRRELHQIRRRGIYFIRPGHCSGWSLVRCRNRDPRVRTQPGKSRG